MGFVLVMNSYIKTQCRKFMEKSLVSNSLLTFKVLLEKPCPS